MIETGNTYNETIRANMEREYDHGLNSHGFGKGWESGYILAKRGHFAVNNHEEFQPGTLVRVREYATDPGYVEVMLPNGSILTESPNLISKTEPIPDPKPETKRERFEREYDERETARIRNEWEMGSETDTPNHATLPIARHNRERIERAYLQSSESLQCCGNEIRIPDSAGFPVPCEGCGSIFEREDRSREGWKPTVSRRTELETEPIWDGS